MPSTRDPVQIPTGPGKLHMDVATAAADLFTTAAGALLSSINESISGEVAIPKVTATYTGGVGGDASRLITSTSGPFWVGDNVSTPLKDLFTVVNAVDDSEIFNPLSNSYVVVASITPASVGSGFYAGGDLTVNFNTPVPQSVQYKIYFGRRGVLSALPPETSVNPVIRRSHNRVRFPEFDRTGLAPTSVAAPYDIVTNRYPDPYMAQWKALLRGSTQSVVADFGGHAGFVYVGRKKNVLDASDQSLRGHQASAFLAVYEKSIASGTLGGQTVWTKIDSSLTANIIAADVIECNAADYFYLTGPNRTAVRVGVDMVEVSYSTGIKEVYLVSSLVNGNPRRITVTTLGGATVGFDTQAVTIRWIRAGFFVGGDNDSTDDSFLTTGFDNHYKGMGHFVPGAITANPGVEIAQYAPFFAAGTVDSARSDSARSDWNFRAFTWGGFTESASAVVDLGRRRIYGSLMGDGSVESYSGRIRGFLANRGTDPHPVISSNQTYVINPRSKNQVTFDFTGSAQVALTVDLDPTYVPAEGDMIVIFISYNLVTPASAAELSTTTWQAGKFRFSGADATTPSPAGTIIKYMGHMSGGLFHMTRTDYEA